MWIVAVFSVTCTHLETFGMLLWSNKQTHRAPMKHPRQLILPIFFACLVGAAFAANPRPSEAPALLPQAFAGWQMEGTAHASSDPAVADASNARVLQEYRFTDLASATYTRDDGRTLKIRAARFADASGAFGAYTFY